ncbi:hypothetical protein ACWDG9_17050 [Streptomyces sp. NPDC001073]
MVAGHRLRGEERQPCDSAHDDDLRGLAYQLMDAAVLQRGRLTGLALRADDLVGAGRIAEQISLDTGREDRLAAEHVSDLIRDKFGPRVIGPAGALRPAS